jgi:hypothetical protein
MANKLSSENAAQNGRGATPDQMEAHARVITRADNNPPSLVALLIEQLIETYRLEFAKSEPIRKLANLTEQKIETDEHLAAWTTIYNDAKALFNQLDTARKNENRPLEAAVNETFKRHTDPLARIMAWVKDKADAYNREKLRKQRADEAAERERLAEAERKAREDAAIAAEFGDTTGAIEQVTRAVEIQQQAEQTMAPAKAADVARVRADGGGLASAASLWKFTIEDYSKVDLNSIRNFFPAAEVDKAVAKVVKLQKSATKIEGVKVYEDVGTKFRS